MKNPVAFAAALATLAFLTAACSSPQAQDTAAVQVDKEMVIKATNFTFEPAEYRIRAGETIRFVLDSTGNHGVKIKEIGLELDPNNTSMVITPKDKGTYPFQCTILCGTGHKEMTGTLIVE